MSAAWLEKCITAAACSPEFVDNWARMRGIKFPKTALDRLVDHASGHGDAIAEQFIEDVKNLVYDRLPEPQP